MPRKAEVRTSDKNSHTDCNRSGTIETVDPSTGRVESNPCAPCGGNGTQSTLQHGGQKYRRGR